MIIKFIPIALGTSPACSQLNSVVFRHWNYQNPIILARDIKHCVHTSQLCDANCSDSCLWLFITWNAFLWLYIYIVRPKKIIPAIYCTFEYILGTILYFAEYLYSIQLIKGRNQCFKGQKSVLFCQISTWTAWVHSLVHPEYILSTSWVQSEYNLMGKLGTSYDKHVLICFILSDIHLDCLST